MQYRCAVRLSSVRKTRAITKNSRMMTRTRRTVSETNAPPTAGLRQHVNTQWTLTSLLGSAACVAASQLLPNISNLLVQAAAPTAAAATVKHWAGAKARWECQQWRLQHAVAATAKRMRLLRCIQHLVGSMKVQMQSIAQTCAAIVQSRAHQNHCASWTR